MCERRKHKGKTMEQELGELRRLFRKVPNDMANTPIELDSHGDGRPRQWLSSGCSRVLPCL